MKERWARKGEVEKKKGKMENEIVGEKQKEKEELKKKDDNETKEQ